MGEGIWWNLSRDKWTQAESLRHCRDLARTHYENFTVTSVLLPVRLREPMAVVYAYCRGVDDLGDEAPGNRLALLEQWSEALERTLAGDPPSHPVFVALAQVLKKHALTPDLFRRLISANRRDQVTPRWNTRAELLDYCTCSANPVGRLVLELFGATEADALQLSDHICTGLQLANFWQDVRRDFDERNRIYLPLEDMARFNVGEADVAAGQATRAFKDLMREEVTWARCFFADGAGLLDKLRGRLRFDVGLFKKGGETVLDMIEAQDFDVLAQRPEVGSRRKFVIFLRSLPLLVHNP